MPKRERDSYEADDVRVFDGGEDDDETEGSNLPIVIVIALLVLAALGGLVWISYNNGVARGRADVPAHQVAQNTAGEAPATAPSSGEESPAARHIKVYQQPAGADDGAYQEVTPNAEQTAKPAPVQSAPAQAKVVVPAPAAATQSTLPAAKPQTKTVAATPPVPATAAPKQLSPTNPLDKAAPAAPTAAVAATAGGAYVLQIGAYKSEGEANAAWKLTQAKHAALLSSLSSNVQKADLGDKGVWYRLRAGSFADKNAAAALCDRLKAEGGICFPAK